MNLFVFIVTGVIIMAPTVYAKEQSALERQIERRRDTIEQARAECARMLSATPDADRLNVLMLECYRGKEDIFRPIEGTVPRDRPTKPIFRPDPNRP